MIDVICSNLQDEIDKLLASGYRLDMIMPADSPREALMSKAGQAIRLTEGHPKSAIPNPKSTGRAGMEYRDLIPDRLDGHVIASHIRINDGGPVPDYVHYHKVDFQIIYCTAGSVRVVYEDQGPPFLIQPGDCILQAPGIRHRVLESSSGAEVIEVSSPAEHETWVDHELLLPSDTVATERTYGGQRFVRHIANEATWLRPGDGLECRETGILEASGGIGDVRVYRTSQDLTVTFDTTATSLLFVLKGTASHASCTYKTGGSFVLDKDTEIVIRLTAASQLLVVRLLAV